MQSNKSDGDEVLSAKQAAEISGYSVDTIRRAARDGDLEAFQTRRGSNHRVRRSALNAWLSRSSAEASA